MTTRNPDKRSSGIAPVGDLPWGSHFRQFYTTQQDMTEVVVPYFRAGLESNELCVWVTSDFLTTQDALAALGRGVPGFPDHLARRQIEVFPHTDWYLKGGSFDLKRTLDLFVDRRVLIPRPETETVAEDTVGGFARVDVLTEPE